MKLVYHPEGTEEPRKWVLHLGKLKSKEIEAIEKRTGMHYGGEFKESLVKGNALARRGLLWTLLRREHPTLKFDDLDFCDDEVILEYDAEELQQIYDEIEASVALSDEDKAFKLTYLGAEIAKQRAEEEAAAGEAGSAADDEGKALTSSSADATG